jgi:type II secretory pathway pseudopilin PulG
MIDERTASHAGQAGGQARRGGVMILTLACLAVAAAIGLAMLRSATVSHRQLRQEQQLRQVERLLMAAGDVARSRQAAGQAIDDVIQLTTGDLADSGSARVVLTVDPDDATAAQVVVEYPLEGPLTVRRSRTISLASPSPSLSSSSTSLPTLEESLP